MDSLAKYILTLPQTEQTVSDLFTIAVETNDIELNRIVRREASKIKTLPAFDIVRKTYILGGRHSFDDYMIACEWNREPQARFWLPRRAVLEGKHKIASQIQQFMDDPETFYLGFALPPGCGKALSDDTPILTRNGWRNHGDLVVGDEVIGMDGEFKKVTHVFPKCQLNRRVHFANHTYIDCHEDHEWYVYTFNGGKHKVCETKQLEKFKLNNGKEGRGKTNYYQIPPHEIIVGEEKELYVDPYVLGVWLGDGTTTAPSVNCDKADLAMIEELRKHYPDGHEREHKITHVATNYFIGLGQDLRKYGLCRKHEKIEKFIPDEYLTASISQRLELLAGLIDTDGCASFKRYEFTTADESLKDSFVKLLATFGLRACVTRKEPKMSSSGIQGRRAYYVIAFTPNMHIPCRLERKRMDYVSNPRRIAVTCIEEIEPKQGNCIEVEGGLYLAGEALMPTHNSTMIKFLLAYIGGKYPHSANMYSSYSDGMTKMMFDSLKSIMTDDTEYCHNLIFPNNGTLDLSAEYKTLSYRKKGDFPTIGLTSIGGSVTGRTRANKFLITDDLVKDGEMARSPERLGKLWNDYNDTLTTRMIGDNVKQIMLGTRWSVHDPQGKMQSKHGDNPRYHFIAIPVCDEDGHSNFEYEHPDNYTDKKIADLKENLDPVSWSCLYMQRGIEREGLAMPTDDLQYYDGVLPDGEPDAVKFVTDVAWGSGDSLSMPIAYIYGDEVFIHDVLFDKGDKTKTKPRVVGKINAHKCNGGRFEANNGGDEYADDIKRILRETHGYHCNITHKKAPTNMGKMQRIEQFLPDIKSFYYISPKFQSEEYRRFMEEATSFSFTSKNPHDDAIDSLAMLADYLFHGNKMVSAIKRPF